MQRVFKSTRTEKKVQWAYGIAFVLLVISYLFTLYSNRQLVRQATRVEHTNKVIRMLDNTLATVIDGETGVRGYILTKNIQFLFPYYGTEQRTDSLMEELQQFTADSPLQLERLRQLQNLLKQRFDIFRFHLREFDSHNRQITDSMYSQQELAKSMMENIRKRIALMQRHEKRLLEDRVEKQENNIEAINTITIISLILAIALVIFGLVTYMHVSRERKKGLNAIKEYQSNLNFRIQELDEANTELIKMRSLEKFAATGRIARTIAHEIRNPLTNINLATEQLRDELSPETDKENSQFLFEMINRNSSRINQLISDLLNSTKFTELNYERVDVNEFVEEALKEAQDRINLHNIKVTRDYIQEKCIISIDKVKMKIALLNLIINAIEAIDNKSDGELVLKTSKGGGKCRITIEDNGPGIEKEMLSRIFEPYFTNKQKGNGLGLTNTQNIILNHGGEISVESTRGKGTHFTIILELFKEK